TTGVSKGAILTHGNLVANTLQGLEMFKPFIIVGKEVILTALPLYHIFAFTANLMIFYLAGGRNILVPSPRPLSNLKAVMLGEPITWFTGVNTLFAGLMHEPWFKEQTSWSLKGSIAGGMALVPVVGERWEAMTKTPIYQGYGLTETSPVATLNPFQRAKREAIGVPIPGTDVRLVDDQGHDVAHGEPGELLVKGPQVMQGYWQRPDETAKVLRDGWLATGDIARMDEDHYLQIVDRKKDMILVSGFNVYPNEVEAVLATHPAVADMAVVGVPDDECGEIVVAFVTKKDPAITEDAIRQHCKASLTGYKVPRMVVFKDDLPKSNVGKVLRKDLRDEAQQAYLKRKNAAAGERGAGSGERNP
ncbi:MAG TPA: AMP-binding protein, partial [Vicinamibacterales bacterium]|nr:AMP-binding protein [Vicinamibacterales bacterium]